MFRTEHFPESEDVEGGRKAILDVFLSSYFFELHLLPAKGTPDLDFFGHLLKTYA